MMRVLTALATTFTVAAVAIEPSWAVQVADGTVYFIYPPQLEAATTSEKGVNVRNATYYFTLSIPENAGEPLQRVTIDQGRTIQEIRFYLKDTRAFLRTRGHKKQRLSLTGVMKERKSQVISITFAPPVPPGNTVTIVLYPRQNPLYAGVYLFGVTAFPVGEKSHGQFVGFGRLQFYDRGGPPGFTP